MASGKKTQEKKEPLVRLAQRQGMSTRKKWIIRILSIIVALILGAFIFMTLGYSPFSVYGSMINGSLGGKLAIQQTIKIAIPLLGASLAIAPAFKMKFWNIGVEGQITMGGIFATFFALNFAETWPSWLLILVMCVAGAIGGALWGLIPAVFRAKWGTNETLFTLMMNYIAIGIVKYLQGGPWEKRPRGTQLIGLFKSGARMPNVWNITIGVFLIILLVFFMFCYLKYTKHGFEIAVVGESEPTARYAGIDVAKVIVRTMAVSGAIAGIVGFILVSGIKYTLSDSVAGGVGFTGITVAWLAQLNAQYGLDLDLIPGFFVQLKNLVTGNFGDSWKYTVPVLQKFNEVIWVSFIMGAISLVFDLLIAVPLGIVAATKQYSVTDYTVTTVALLGMSLPTFFFATLLKLVFSVKLGWFDLVGLTGRDFNSLSRFGQILDMGKHLVLPIVTLVFISIGSWMRYVRTNMLEVLNADYIRTARAKGLSEKKVIYHHAFRNTLIPLVTFIGGSLPGLFAGALITETLFAIPGIGYISYNAMVAGDIPFSMFYMTFLAILTLLGNLISDILYAVVDPRVRIA